MMEITGRVVEHNRNEEWGCETGIVLCPQCNREVEIGVNSDNTCECGYVWEIVVSCVGRSGSSF